MTTSRVFRPFVAILLLLAVVLSGCNSAEESTLANLINSERSKAGVRTLVLNDNASAVARDWAKTMANQNRLYHNPNLRRDIENRVGRGWRMLGENVAYNPSINDMHRRFMGSSGHRANILNRSYTHLGVGVVAKNGQFWAAQVFIAY
jgi:uncharacterized protein YkwD